MTSKKILFFILRVAVFAWAVAFVLTQIDFADRTVMLEDGTRTVDPGVFTLFRDVHPGWAALAFLSFFMFTFCGIVRWWFLLLTQGIRMSLFEAFRLSYIGIFFNNVIPGLTGGDLVKAVYVARRVPEARARAVTTIFVDRVLGLLALMVLGSVAALAGIGNPVFRNAALLLICLLAAGAVISAPILSKKVRRTLRLERVLGALPFQNLLREVDAAIQLYRTRAGVVSSIFLFSMFGQVFGLIDAWFMARALGIDLSFLHVVIILPVIQVFCVVPISPGAWGVGEGLYVYFFRFINIGASGAVGISIGCRLIYTVQSLLGGLFLLHAPEEVRAAQREAVEEARRESMSG
jgi:glycosyltransferase 2 family protein